MKILIYGLFIILTLACSVSKSDLHSSIDGIPYLKIGDGEVNNVQDQDSFRRVVYRNINGIMEAMPTIGTFAAVVCINFEGKVVVAEVDTTRTDITDPKIIRKLLHAAMGYRYDAAPENTGIQCGRLTFKMDIKALR